MLCFRHYTPIIHSKLHKQYVQIFVCGHYLFRQANIFPRMKLKHCIGFEEQIVLRTNVGDGYFCAKMEASGFIIFEYFLQHMQVSKLGNITQIFPSV